MAKSFACKDIGMQCNFEARAENEELLMQQIQAHAAQAHNMANIDAQTMQKIKAAIKES